MYGFVPGISILLHCSMHFVFLPVPHCSDYYSLQYNLRSGSVMPSALFFFLKFALTIQGHLLFHTNFMVISFSCTGTSGETLDQVFFAANWTHSFYFTGDCGDSCWLLRPPWGLVSAIKLLLLYFALNSWTRSSQWPMPVGGSNLPSGLSYNPFFLSALSLWSQPLPLNLSQSLHNRDLHFCI